VNGPATSAPPATARRRFAIGALLALAWLLAWVWLATRDDAAPWVAQALRGLHLAEHAGIHVALAIWFGCSLRAGATPLISRLAERVHGRLAPSKQRYTRALTRMWTAYFAGVALLSVVLYAALPFASWMLFADVVTPLLLGALFFGEYAVRYRLHPEFERARVREMWRAWFGARAPRGEPR
jgi:uncharacterized membrane protein